MTTGIRGLHHVTAISGGPQENLDFMVRTLRQRFVERTVNFDAPDTYHLSYGDRAGSPGTIMTPAKGRGSVVDLVTVPGTARMGAGTIHHVASRTRDDADQLARRERIAAAGLDVIP